MYRSARLAGFALLAVLLAAGCARNPEPEPVQPEPDPVVDTTDYDAEAEAARLEAESARLCDRALAALEAGNFDTARELLRQAQRDYPGTECALSAAATIDRVDALEAITARVHFEFDKSDITDEAAAVLQLKADALRQHPGVTLTIEGHCDERGSLEYNLALGMRRADAAMRYLVSLGLDADRFRTVSYGEERPLVNMSNESAWAQNRRDEFVMVNMGDL
jgi:peptidoglycan-associated lipoprotein